MRCKVLWLPPEAGFVKFNVNGATRVRLGPGPALIGGVLRDEHGVVTACLFPVHQPTYTLYFLILLPPVSTD